MVNYCIHNILLLDPALRQDNPVYAVLLYFLMTHFNIIFAIMTGTPNGVFPSGLLTRTLYTRLLSSIGATCVAQPIVLDFDHPNTIW